MTYVEAAADATAAEDLENVDPAGFRWRRIGRVALITLDRPEVLNALNAVVMKHLVDLAERLDADPTIGCLVLTGEGRAFAAGADISEMTDLDFDVAHQRKFLAAWDRFAALTTPKIAAVAGYALGGGCELAMMCDFIIADRTARFGQPEVKLGLIPGMGGSQRLTRAVGKQLAMDMILTGRMIDAERALQAGVVARVVDEGEAVTEALEAAEVVASYSKTTTASARSAVLQAESSSLQAGLAFERQVYYATFGTEAAREGVTAFLEKRQPNFQHPPK